MTESNTSQLSFEPLIHLGALNGTFLQGYVAATFDELCDVFGEPHFYDDGKTSVEWGLVFEDTTIASIYDGNEVTSPTGKYEWHVGGSTKRAVALVQAAIEAHRLGKAE